MAIEVPRNSRMELESQHIANNTDLGLVRDLEVLSHHYVWGASQIPG